MFNEADAAMTRQGRPRRPGRSARAGASAAAKAWCWCSAIIGSRCGPNARGGEIDLILRERDGTLVFVEVRARAARGFGGALASVSATKQRRLVRAAQHYLMRLAAPPPCRFDVVAIDGGELRWLKAAFDAPWMLAATTTAIGADDERWPKRFSDTAGSGAAALLTACGR